MADSGKVTVLSDGAVECGPGNPMTGIAYTNDPPRIEFDNSARFSLRPGSDTDKTVPLGLATYRTIARWRNYTLTPIIAPLPGDKPKGENL